MEAKTAVIKWRTKGHSRQKLFLEKILRKERKENGFARSYVFSGPAHVGKTATALDFARALLCSDADADAALPCGECPVCLMPMDTNPDFFRADGLGEIKIETVRNLQRSFGLKAFAGGSKVAIIAGAEKLNPEAANAMLKFFEEPGSQTIIILVTSRSQSLPATILSRAQILRFSLPDGTSQEEFYGTLGHFAKSEALRRICGARLGLAALALEKPEFAEYLFQAASDLKQLSSGDLKTRLSLTAALAEKESSELIELVNYWLIFLDAEMRISADQDSLSTFARRAQAIWDSATGLNYNLNKKLVLDNLAVKL